MGSPFLAPCLVTLRAEFNRLAPGRDKSSDGWIGDAAHQAEPGGSDHNPDARGMVHAIDVDEDLRLPGVTMENCVQEILARCRAGVETRLWYVIYERRIWVSPGWAEETYTGSNPHDKHAHFSARYVSSLETNTGPWGLLEGDDVDAAEFFASAARGVKGESAGATAGDRANRDNAAVVVRFALGYNWNQQQGEGAQPTVLGKLNDILASGE